MPSIDDREFRAAAGRLCRRLDGTQKQQLDFVVVDGKLPGWFRGAKLGLAPTPEGEAERLALLSGLEALAARS